MQERNVTDDMSPNFAVRRKNDSMTAAELFRRIEALKIAGTIGMYAQIYACVVRAWMRLDIYRKIRLNARLECG
jgi:hypothetical protein